jgi:hypothetical protein
MHDRKFHHFIIITIIVPLEHDSVIRRKNSLGTTTPARKHELDALIAADISRFWRSDVVAASNGMLTPKRLGLRSSSKLAE